MKLIIDIPEERLDSIKHFGIKQNEVSMLERALISGNPLDDVKAKIEEMRIKFMEQGGVYEHSAYGLDYAIVLLDNIGKAEGEDNQKAIHRKVRNRYDSRRID